ncbi:MAG: DNA polymerase III subunit, partial [Planctomycetota bacterium]
CRSILEGGSHTDFIEVDAATNSGKAEIKKIIEELEYTTFSGGRRIYLFDESHQLSREALDALLKPLEENLPGSNQKRLVCIFCTTEPEKMRATILSRCAPAFVIRPLSPEVIAKRLAFVCDSEGITYDADVLPLIAEVTECHIRDALKAIEGVSMLGPIDHENASTYLHLDLNDAYLEILTEIGRSLGSAITTAEKIMKRASPLTCYQKLARTAMLAFKVSLGVEKPPTFWNASRVADLASKKETLLGYTSVFSSRPGRPTPSMLYCDIAQLHHAGGAVEGPVVIQKVITTPEPAPVAVPTPPMPTPTHDRASTGIVQEPPGREDSVVVDGRAVNHGDDEPDGPRLRRTLELDVDTFCWLLGSWVAELDEAGGGSPGRPYLDRH